MLRTVRSRTVLITGAARGIGAAAAKKFAAQGDRVLIHFRSDEQQAEAVRASLAPSEAGEHMCLRSALDKADAPAALISAALAACDAPAPGGIGGRPAPPCARRSLRKARAGATSKGLGAS